MKNIITLFLCFLLATSIILPSVSHLFTDGVIEWVDILDDDEKKEAKGEKELKETLNHTTSELAFVRTQEKQSLLTFHRIHRYDVHLDILVPPPQHIG